MRPTATIQLLAFDAYGTLFDVHSVTALAEGLFPGEGAALSQLWRTKQLEYTWLQALMRRRDDFAGVTRAALEYAAEARRLTLTSQARSALLDQYLKLEPFPEVREALAALGGVRKIILSNGTSAMLEPLVRHTGLESFFEAIVTVDEVGTYKPSPEVYARVEARTGVTASRSALVSSNCWDAIGAQNAGFRTIWVNRAGAPVDRHAPPPERIVRSLAEVVGALE